MLQVYVDAGAGMAALGEVAVWAFDLPVWGECAQAPTDELALAKFRRRVRTDDLVVLERITGLDQVFQRDLLPATEEEVVETVALLRRHRAITVALIEVAGAEGALEVEDDQVVQPAWMSWRTPEAIGRHLIEDSVTGYLKRTGLPRWSPSGELLPDLRKSLEHLVEVIEEMPRDLRAEYRGEVWTAVKLLRRQAWHERVEHVFLRRRLRAAGLGDRIQRG